MEFMIELDDMVGFRENFWGGMVGFDYGSRSCSSSNL